MEASTPDANKSEYSLARTATKQTTLAAAIVVGLAAAYFLLTYNRTLNPIDEGLLLNNCQNVASGHVPHRDFYDVYGPASYWLGGALFRLFGTKIIVIRCFMLVLKTAMALMIFLISRKLMPTVFALIAAALFVLNWGDPLFPAMNILYAGHPTHFLALLGIFFMMLYVEKQNRAWLVGTSLCVGFSLLFKFHSDVFHIIGFSVFLSLKELSRGFISEGAEIGGRSVGRVSAGLMRTGKCAGVLGVFVFYLAVFTRDNLSLHYFITFLFPYFIIFLFPFFLFLGHILIADLRGYRSDREKPPLRGGLKNCYGEILLLLGGPLFLAASVAAYYYSVNGLDELMFDTFALPMAMKFYKPMEDYRLHAALIAGAVILISAMIGIGKRVREGGNSERNFFSALFLVLALLPPAAFYFGNVSLETLQMRTIYILPPATLLLTSFLFITAWKEERLTGANSRETLFLGLVFIFACQGLIMSFPRTDTTHIRVNSTVIFTLISFLLWRLYAVCGAAFSRRGKILASVSIAVGLTMLAAPYAWNMKSFYFHDKAGSDSFGSGTGKTKSPAKLDLDFPRAQGLDVSRCRYPLVWAEIVKVAQFVRKHTESGDRIFVMCGPQIIYFLTERHSAVRKENYFVYLAATGLIDRVDTVRLTDEQLLEKLIEAKPRFIVQTPGGRYTQRIVALWPKTAEYIAENYRAADESSFIYQVLQLRSRARADAPGK